MVAVAAGANTSCHRHLTCHMPFLNPATILSSSKLRPCLKTANHYQNTEAKIICTRYFPVIISIDPPFCNMLHKRSITVMLKAMGWGVYPGKSGLHENILHNRSTKDCHLMQKNTSAMDVVAVHTTKAEKSAPALLASLTLCTPCSIPS